VPIFPAFPSWSLTCRSVPSRHLNRAGIVSDDTPIIWPMMYDDVTHMCLGIHVVSIAALLICVFFFPFPYCLFPLFYLVL
jgi:hypothetical protein